MRNNSSRVGFVLFSIYLALYGGFVLLNAFQPQLMERTPIAGLNLAIIFGFGLIIGALVLSLIYGFICSRSADTVSKPGETHPREAPQ